jgi:hypothetical protein
MRQIKAWVSSGRKLTKISKKKTWKELILKGGGETPQASTVTLLLSPGSRGLPFCRELECPHESNELRGCGGSRERPLLP